MDLKQVRAIYNENTIRVYQAYSPHIALPALDAGKFISPFKMTRMTWIKPSFCWMMYRSDYASKEGQEVILAIDILREGFDWALENAALSTFKESSFSCRDEWHKHLSCSPIRVQWDPERHLELNKVENTKAIQIGLSEEAAKLYVNEWTQQISDVTPTAITAQKDPSISPHRQEKVYPVSDQVARNLLID